MEAIIVMNQLLLICRKKSNYSRQPFTAVSRYFRCNNVFYVSVCSQNHQNKEGCWLSCIFCLFSHVTKVLGRLVYLIHQKSFDIAGQEWKLILSQLSSVLKKTKEETKIKKQRSHQKKRHFSKLNLLDSLCLETVVKTQTCQLPISFQTLAGS